MFEVVDRIDYEIINVQLIDNPENKKIYLDTCFMKQNISLNDGFTNNNYIENDIRNSQIEEDFAECSLDEVMRLLVEDLDLYNFIYDMPKITIENEEWDLFFTTVFQYYEKLDLNPFFLHDMIDLNRYAIALALVYGKDVSLDIYMNACKYISSDVIYSSNIIEIMDILDNKFKKDISSIDFAVFFNKREEVPVIYLEESLNIKHQTESLKEQLEELGYEVETSIKPKDNCKILNLEEYRMEKKNRKKSFTNQI